jgi:hypothetical protein
MNEYDLGYRDGLNGIHRRYSKLWPDYTQGYDDGEGERKLIAENPKSSGMTVGNMMRHSPDCRCALCI